MEADDGSDDEMNEENLSEEEDPATEKRLVNFLSITSIKLLIYFVTILFCFWGNIGF